MIKLYTRRSSVADLAGIMDVDASFEAWVQKDMLGEQELDLLKTYEKAEYNSDGDLVGRFKEFPLKSVSSGVKTLLLISLHSRGQLDRTIQYINISECGSNVLDSVFDLAENMDIKLLLMHTRLRGCKDRTFLVNDKVKATNVRALMVNLGSCLNGGE